MDHEDPLLGRKACKKEKKEFKKNEMITDSTGTIHSYSI